MFIERWGEGPAHFFGIHGWSGDHRTFLPLAKDMPPGVTFWSVDLPGSGRSEPPSHWELGTIVDELARAVPTPVTLVGNCSGAILSLLLAQKIPQQVQRVILIDAFAEWPWYFRIFTSKSIGRYAYISTFANPVGRWITNLSLASKRKADSHLTQGFAQTDHNVTYRYLTILKDAGSAESFQGLPMPIEIAYGERSFEAVRKSAAVWHRLWPQSRVWCLPGAGHLPIVEATAALRKILFQEIVCPIAL